MFAGAVQGAIMGEERQGRGCTEVISRVLIQSLESTPVSGRIVDLSFPSVSVVTRWILNIHIFQATYFSRRVKRPGQCRAPAISEYTNRVERLWNATQQLCFHPGGLHIGSCYLRLSFLFTH